MTQAEPSRLPEEVVLAASEDRLRDLVGSTAKTETYELESLSVGQAPASAKQQALERLRDNPAEAVTRRLRRKGIVREAEESSLEAMVGGPVPFPDSEALTPSEIAIGLERIIGRNELLGIQYLDAGQVAARCIGRIVVRRGSSRMDPMGTGFLVGPGLLMTNNHVLPTVASARGGVVEMNYQCGIDGRQLTPVVFSLDPEKFFVTSDQRELDFTLIAVQETAADGSKLANFGFKSLTAVADEVIDGESVTIIQHPSGEPKQIALRENYVLKIPDPTDRFLYYQTDTAPGSSGAGVFNDDWEVVALHHSGYARRNEKNEVLARDGRVWTTSMGESQIDWIANEGVRIAAIVKHLMKPNDLTPEKMTILKDALRAVDASVVVSSGRESVSSPPPVSTSVAPSQVSAILAEPSKVWSSTTMDLTVNIPVHISVQLGTIQLASPVASEPSISGFEKIEIDTDYSNREGYDPAFLGGGNRKVPLPKLTEEMQSIAARLTDQVDSRSPFELKYHHYSVVLNSKRRLAFFTAVNIDGIDQQQLDKREKDKWIFDPRLPVEFQIGNTWYARPFDRGHLVRRLDPAWGRSVAIAKQANDDTFHFTNCSPQHSKFNQGKNLWQGLENYLLDTANKEDRRITVFTGPIFEADDPDYEGVQIPRRFWKVAAWVRSDGSMGAAGFIVDQSELLSEMGLESTAEEVARTFQTSIEEIEKDSQLSFGKLKQFDTMSNGSAPLESGGAPLTELESLSQIKL